MSGRFYGSAPGTTSNQSDRSGDNMGRVLDLLTEQREVMFNTQQQNESLMMLCDKMSSEVENLKGEVVTMKETISALNSKVEESNHSIPSSSKKGKSKLPIELSVSLYNLRGEGGGLH